LLDSRETGTSQVTCFRGRRLRRSVLLPVDRRPSFRYARRCVRGGQVAARGFHAGKAIVRQSSSALPSSDSTTGAAAAWAHTIVSGPQGANYPSSGRDADEAAWWLVMTMCSRSALGSPPVSDVVVKYDLARIDACGRGTSDAQSPTCPPTNRYPPANHRRMLTVRYLLTVASHPCGVRSAVTGL
jgi:hypothetical protein